MVFGNHDIRQSSNEPTLRADSCIANLSADTPVVAWSRCIAKLRRPGKPAHAVPLCTKLWINCGKGGAPQSAPLFGTRRCLPGRRRARGAPARVQRPPPPPGRTPPFFFFFFFFFWRYALQASRPVRVPGPPGGPSRPRIPPAADKIQLADPEPWRARAPRPCELAAHAGNRTGHAVDQAGKVIKNAAVLAFAWSCFLCVCRPGADVVLPLNLGMSGRWHKAFPRPD